jgi:hypothetical protein
MHVGTTNPKVEDFLPLEQRKSRRLTSNFLTHTGRLEMVNLILYISTAHFLYRKHCMWRGSDLNNMKPPLAAWSLVTVPGPKKMEVLVFLI